MISSHEKNSPRSLGEARSAVTREPLKQGSPDATWGVNGVRLDKADRLERALLALGSHAQLRVA